MTQTACVPVREPVSKIQCEAPRLDVQPETLRSTAALQNEAIADSLIPCLKIKGPYRRGMALDDGMPPDAGIALCAGYAGSRHGDPKSSDQYIDGFRAFLARALPARVGVYGIVRIFNASSGRLKQFTV